MKKPSISFKRFAIPAAFLLWLPVLLYGRTIEVCPDCPVKSIRTAIEQASDGDVILIRAGLYREGRIVIDKPLTIQGEGYPALDGENESEVLVISANGVTVEGLQIQNVGTSYLQDRAGIRVKRSRNFVIRNNRLLNTFFGIYLEYAKKGIVEGNHISGLAKDEASSGNAVHAWHCDSLLINNNYIKGHRDGIYFEFVNNSSITGNLSELNLRYGLHFMFSNDDHYANNIFRNNGAGVAVMFSKKIDMWDNRFEYNWGRASYGLLLKEIYDAEIHCNEFIGNTIGITVEGSTRVNYLNNDFRSNGWAVKMAGGCLDNHFTQNNFIANSLDLVVNNKAVENTFNGNYWSEYSGYDLDRDGVGDVPHRPVKLFSFILSRTPEAIVLLRSLFIDLINFSEKVSPVFTPANVLDNHPLMQPIS
jgi:nitrous oxidase accessory protein